MTEPMSVFPFKPGDWATDNAGQVAKVRSVYEGNPGEVLLDLILFSHSGERVGRDSPPMGGPRTFEPACSSDGWSRIKEPAFPISLKWVADGKGKTTARYWTGDPLPPANWKRPARMYRGSLRIVDNKLKQALEKIADGHNDARALAAEALGRKAKSK